MKKNTTKKIKRTISFILIVVAILSVTVSIISLAYIVWQFIAQIWNTCDDSGVLGALVLCFIGLCVIMLMVPFVDYLVMGDDKDGSTPTDANNAN